MDRHRCLSRNWCIITAVHHRWMTGLGTCVSDMTGLTGHARTASPYFARSRSLGHASSCHLRSSSRNCCYNLNVLAVLTATGSFWLDLHIRLQRFSRVIPHRFSRGVSWCQCGSGWLGWRGRQASASAPKAAAFEFYSDWRSSRRYPGAILEL